MSRPPLYDTLGTTYALTRRTEPRIAEQLWAALADARTVLNVGAGTGSYEPSDRFVTAVEPSSTSDRVGPVMHRGEGHRGVEGLIRERKALCVSGDAAR
jgi:hypothetical protein